MDHYRERLGDVVRPEDPAERDDSHATLTDFEALYLRMALTDYAAYKAPTADHEEIALAYLDYINMVVRDEEKSMVKFYAHTETAREVLYEASRNIGPYTEIGEHLATTFPEP